MKFEVYSGGKKVTGARELELAVPGVHPWHREKESFDAGTDVGLFESLRTYPGGKIFREDQHLKRLETSAHTIQYPFPFRRAEVKNELHSALKAYHAAHPKSNQGSLFLRACLWDGKIFVMVGERKHASAIYQTGVALQTSPVKRTHTNALTAQVKTSAYHNAFLATLEIKAANTYEWVFLDANGYVTEVRIGNLFIIKRGELLTPPEDGILNGVTRGVVIECALRIGLAVKETPLTRHDVYNGEEAFLTNTSWEILPVSSLDGRKIGTSIPGKMTQKLKQTFQEMT